MNARGSRSVRLGAMIVLATAGGWVSALGLAGSVWMESFQPYHGAAALLVAGAWHACWVATAVTGSGWSAGALCWVVSVVFSGRHAGAAAAIVLETAPLLIALSLADSSGWEQRAARWRRALAGITAQLRMGTGWVPWAREAWTLFLHGKPEAAFDPAPFRYLAELDDAAARLDAQIARRDGEQG